MKLFIDVWYVYNAGSIKMSYSANLFTSFASKLQRDLLNRSTNPFAWGWYGVDQ